MQNISRNITLAWLALACIVVVPLRAQLTPAPVKMPLVPPTFGYTTANAFSGLTFGQPVCIASPPGETNRLFVLDKLGHMYVITNLTSPNLTTFLDLSGSGRIYTVSESGLLGVAFHPDYANPTNRYFFVFYSASTNGSVSGLFQRVSRFQTTSTNANRALTNSELILINQKDPAGNHNGSDVHFGPDGYLYFSVGDGGVQYDGDRNSQLITSNFFSAICRIDVDTPPRPGNLMPNPHRANTNNGAINYRIPADNPYIGRTNFDGISISPTNIRTEFYATGFRNPWRFSFDPVTGFLYCGDVGQDMWEEVDVITKGGDYGWAYLEGTHPGYRASNTVTEPLIPPIQEYQHGTAANQGNAVIGGVVYRGNRLSQLYGWYVFGDNSSGNIWMLHYDGTNTIPFQRITTRSSVSAFGIDPANGDVLMTDNTGGGIYRLTYNSTSNGLPIPPTLADTGAFTNLTALTSPTQSLAASTGLVPYDINVPFWSDNAKKSRWFLAATNTKIGFNADGPWSFANGMVWVKHFDLEMTNGVASSARRLETRLLVKNSNGVYGVTYRWGNSITNAAVVAEEGMDETFSINDGGTIRTQVWHYPARNECVICHTPTGGYALGFNTVQMNRAFGTNENQIAAMSAAGYFTNAVTNIYSFRALATATNEDVSREWRVRSYLAANCGQCHRPGGAGLGYWSASITNFTIDSGLINGLLNNNLGNTNAHVIAPGSLSDSMLLTRISTRGPRQMPPLDTTVVDSNAVALVSAWITNDLANGWSNSTPATPLLIFYGGTNGSAVRFVHPANRAQRLEKAGSLTPPVNWQFVNEPDNTPTYPAISYDLKIQDTAPSTNQAFYRVRLSGP